MNSRWPDDYEIYSPEASDGRRRDWPSILVFLAFAIALLTGVGLAVLL